MHTCALKRGKAGTQELVTHMFLTQPLLAGERRRARGAGETPVGAGAAEAVLRRGGQTSPQRRKLASSRGLTDLATLPRQEIIQFTDDLCINANSHRHIMDITIPNVLGLLKRVQLEICQVAHANTQSISSSWLWIVASDLCFMPGPFSVHSPHRAPSASQYTRAGT